MWEKGVVETNVSNTYLCYALLSNVVVSSLVVSYDTASWLHI